MTASVMSGSSTTALSGFSIWVGAKATFSRISTAAVLCESPTTIIFIKVLPLLEIRNRARLPLRSRLSFVAVQPREQEVHPEEGKEHDGEAEDGEHGGLP